MQGEKEEKHPNAGAQRAQQPMYSGKPKVEIRRGELRIQPLERVFTLKGCRAGKTEGFLSFEERGGETAEGRCSAPDESR